jgi:murein DD-endopeptidase MepM/ murein hydrolase activator NlpD
MATWPVPEWLPQYNFHDAPRSFGSRRDHGKRKHAGCDLYAPKGSPVLAIYPGRVQRVYEFYGKADAVDVDHGCFGVIRYGEIIASDNIDEGQVIDEGTEIGTITNLVGMGNIHPMLHIEFYSGKGTGKLTVPGNDYRRRFDLIDPTEILVILSSIRQTDLLIKMNNIC